LNKSNNRIAPLLLVKLLENFSKKELEGLKHIVTCAYFNTDKYVIKLLDVLIKNILGKPWTSEMTQIRLFNKVFTQSTSEIKKLDKKQKAKLNAKMSLLTRLAERLLRMEKLEKSQSNRCELLMESLLERKQYRLFNKHLAKEKKSIENDPKDLYYFNKLHLFEEEEFVYLINSGQWMREDNFERLMETTDLRYFSKKLAYTLTGLSLMNNKHSKYDFSFLENSAMKFLIKKNIDKSPIFKIQVAIINLYTKKTQDLYLSLLYLIDLHETTISKEYVISFYTGASIFCINQSKMGKSEYNQHYINLNKMLDDKNLLLFNNSLPITKLRNIVTYGCIVKDFDWVKAIITKYSPYLQKKYRNNVMKYSLGYLEFEKKKFQNAIDILLQVDNFQKSYDISKRIMILKSYYEIELHYSEPTAQLFRSLETFIKNHKLLTNNDKIMYKTFIRIFYNLYRIKHQVATVKLEKLKDQIDNAEFISNKLWLLEKIAELEGRK